MLAGRTRSLMRVCLVAVVLSALARYASAEGDPPAITWDWYHAAEIYRADPGMPRRELIIAARYHARAAELGNLSSAYKLAEMYENGVGVARNPARALRWYRMAAERGDRHAQVKVGYFHEKGLAVAAPDQGAAQLWYERAAAQGNPWAFHMLAFLYANGNGVARDPVKAQDYFERSLPETNDAWGQWRLALLVEPLNPARALALLTRSAASGNENARAALIERGCPVPPLRSGKSATGE